MSSITQLLKIDEQITAASEKLGKQKSQRYKILQALGFEVPEYSRHKQEYFITVDSKPTRLWVYWDGSISLEELKF